MNDVAISLSKRDRVFPIFQIAEYIGTGMQLLRNMNQVKGFNDKLHECVIRCLQPFEDARIESFLAVPALMALVGGEFAPNRFPGGFAHHHAAIITKILNGATSGGYKFAPVRYPCNRIISSPGGQFTPVPWIVSPTKKLALDTKHDGEQQDEKTVRREIFKVDDDLDIEGLDQAVREVENNSAAPIGPEPAPVELQSVAMDLATVESEHVSDQQSEDQYPTPQGDNSCQDAQASEDNVDLV